MNNRVRIAGCRQPDRYKIVHEILINPKPYNDTIAYDLNNALLTLKSLCIEYEIEFALNVKMEESVLGSTWRDIFLITSDEGVVAFKLAGGEIFK